MTEQVLVVKKALLSSLLEEKGLMTGKNESFFEIIMSYHEFMPRSEAEENTDYKQIIPYVLLLRDDKIFAMRRLSKGGEARLHGLISLGVGGHIDLDEDGDSNDVLIQGMLREIREEVEIDGADGLCPVGVINDDTTAVGSVHLGLVYKMQVTDARIRETEKLEGFWLSLLQAKELSPQMESWSAIALEAI